MGWREQQCRIWHGLGSLMEKVVRGAGEEEGDRPDNSVSGRPRPESWLQLRNLGEITTTISSLPIFMEMSILL